MIWWFAIIFFILFISFISAYVIDPVSVIYMKRQDIDATIIEALSEDYLASLGIKVNNKIKYNFVRYRDEGYDASPGTEILLGTFHEWNNTYYIDVSVDLYDRDSTLIEVVAHETRHMVVEYLKDQKIINLEKYTEEIAEGNSYKYNELFDSAVRLLKERKE